MPMMSVEPGTTVPTTGMASDNASRKMGATIGHRWRPLVCEPPASGGFGVGDEPVAFPIIQF